MRATFSPDLDGSEASGVDGAPRRVRSAAFAAIGAALVLAGLWCVVAPVPFLSEDWTQLEQLGRVDTLIGALDPAREPLRPLQHAFVWFLAHCGADPTGALPALARAAAFLLHGIACVAVWSLARRAGIGMVATLVALALFVVFPNVKMLAWPAAIGSPGRTAFELVALALLVRCVSIPRAAGAAGRARDGWLGLAAFVVALGFHETAMLLPAILLTWIACVGVGDAKSGSSTLASGVKRALSSLRDPFVLATCAIGAAHLAHLLWFRPDRVHVAKDMAALPANVVKAALSLAPEIVRDIGVEGFRGHRGTVGLVAACVAIGLVACVAVVLLRRGGLGRFAVIAIAIDLGLAVMGAGFVQRYACLASAFAALGLAQWAVTSRGFGVRFVVATVAVLWLTDAVQDAHEIRAAGAAAVSLATEVREVPGTETLLIVGVPDMIGAEEDVPFFNWGGVLFLRAHGVTRPIELLRERTFRTNSDQALVDDAGLIEMQRSGIDVRRWSQASGTLATYAP